MYNCVNITLSIYSFFAWFQEAVFTCTMNAFSYIYLFLIKFVGFF